MSTLLWIFILRVFIVLYESCDTPTFAEGQVTARGGATKDKVFHIECENHQMGRESEKFCYCSYFLCNGAGAGQLGGPGLPLLLLLAGATRGRGRGS